MRRMVLAALLAFCLALTGPSAAFATVGHGAATEMNDRSDGECEASGLVSALRLLLLVLLDGAAECADDDRSDHKDDGEDSDNSDDGED